MSSIEKSFVISNTENAFTLSSKSFLLNLRVLFESLISYIELSLSSRYSITMSLPSYGNISIFSGATDTIIVSRVSVCLAVYSMSSMLFLICIAFLGLILNIKIPIIEISKPTPTRLPATIRIFVIPFIILPLFLSHSY